MSLEPYRRVLATPGFRTLLVVATLARIPVTAVGVTLTLHVVLTLDRGYGAAALVGGMFTIGAALGSPLLGRLVDRRGLRLMVALTTTAEVIFWAVALFMPYPVLVGAAFVAGLLALPVFSLVRQCVAALVPEDNRRPAYSLDAVSVELSFMVGPAVAVLLATAVSTRLAMIAVGVGVVGAGLAFWFLNPPTRSTDTSGAPVVRVPRRTWLRPRLIAVLGVSSASALVLAGTDVSIVAVLREAGQVGWTGAVLALWGAYSMAGGFFFGTVRRPISPLILMGLLSLFTIPVGLAHDWWWLGLALLPAGALCAPTLTSTSDAVSRLAPESARGEAMGLYGSALTTGLALGGPLAGVAIDAYGPAWGFAATGVVSGLLAVIAIPAQLRLRRRPQEPAVLPEPATVAP